jgi:ABC-2 type transport system ATP-binding protein
MAVMIKITDLRKHFGPIVAVDGVTFAVEMGEVLGFLGPNGAGKSTTMKVITGFLPPTGGSAVVRGHDVTTEPIQAKQAIGYLPEGAPGYPDMTPHAFLRFVAQVRGLRGRDRRRRIDEVARTVHLEGVMRQPIETLSKGYRRRVGLAQAILHDPEVLILDEPTDGLDPNQKHEVRTLIRNMADRKAILLSTHILEEVEAVCSRAVIISRGRIVADGTPGELQTRSRYHNAVELLIRADAAELDRQLNALAGVSFVEALDGHDGLTRRRVFPRDGGLIVEDISRLAQSHGWEIDELHVEAGRLDDVFRTVTEGDLVEEAGKDKHA